MHKKFESCHDLRTVADLKTEASLAIERAARKDAANIALMKTGQAVFEAFVWTGQRMHPKFR